MDTIPISKFKATCLDVLEEVSRSGRPVLVTRHGEPIAEIVPSSRPPESGSWLGAARGTGRIVGDLVDPVAGGEEWDALEP